MIAYRYHRTDDSVPEHLRCSMGLPSGVPLAVVDKAAIVPSEDGAT